MTRSCGSRACSAASCSNVSSVLPSSMIDDLVAAPVLAPSVWVSSSYSGLMLGDSLRTGMTIESSGVIKSMESRHYMNAAGALLRCPFACARLPRRHSGHMSPRLCIARAGLSLSHYDAKAHLVVARRIFDSLTPSWEQIGAVWLPLPHVLNALPVQIDCDVSHRRVRRSRSRSCRSRSPRRASRRSCCALTGSRTGAMLARGAVRAQSERALPAEHADDRAAAVRAERAGRAAPRPNGRWPTSCASRPRGRAGRSSRPA